MNCDEAKRDLEKQLIGLINLLESRATLISEISNARKSATRYKWKYRLNIDFNCADDLRKLEKGLATLFRAAEGGSESWRLQQDIEGLLGQISTNRRISG